jgi:hypothetical protein
MQQIYAFSSSIDNVLDARDICQQSWLLVRIINIQQSVSSQHDQAVSIIVISK